MEVPLGYDISTLILIHRAIGYPTAFIVAPLALLAFANAKVHRSWGKVYFYFMVFLYSTGTYFTLTLHDWYSWNFARNLTFNFFGFSMLLYAYRSIRLFRKEGEIKPAKLDWFLAWLLTASVILMILVAAYKNTPMKIFSVVGIWLCVLEWRDVRRPILDKPLLFRRHIRYILGSYFYVLTVVSIVHLKDELPTNARWLWPTVLVIPAIYLVTTSRGSRRGVPIISGISQGLLTRWIVWGIVGLSSLYGSYVVYDLINGPVIKSQG